MSSSACPCNVPLFIGEGTASGLACEQYTHLLQWVRGLGTRTELCCPLWLLACSGWWLWDVTLVLGRHRTSVAWREAALPLSPPQGSLAAGEVK